MAQYQTKSTTLVTLPMAKHVQVALLAYHAIEEGFAADSDGLLYSAADMQIGLQSIVDRPSAPEGFASLDGSDIELAVAIVRTTAKSLIDEGLEPIALQFDVHARETTGLRVMHADDLSVIEAASYIQAVIRHLAPNLEVHLHWAETSDRPEPDVFRGGVAVITAHSILQGSTLDLVGMLKADAAAPQANTSLYVVHGRRHGGDEDSVGIYAAADEAAAESAFCMDVLGLTREEIAENPTREENGHDPHFYVDCLPVNSENTTYVPAIEETCHD